MRKAPRARGPRAEGGLRRAQPAAVTHRRRRAAQEDLNGLAERPGPAGSRGGRRSTIREFGSERRRPPDGLGPSGNRTAKASAMVKFMPFRSASQCHAIGDDAFSYVYTFLHFSLLGTVALVCKRWRAASQDPFWLPDVVCYAWGRAGVSGLGDRCLKADATRFFDYEECCECRLWG